MSALSFKVTKARQAAALTRVMRDHPPKLRFTGGMRKAALGHGSTRADVAALTGVVALLDGLNAADDLDTLDEQALTTALVRVGHVRVASNALRVRIGRALDAVASRERAS